MATYLTLEDVKAHLRVDFEDDDTYIEELMEVVEEIVLTEIQGSDDGEGTVTTAGTTALVGDGSNFTDFTVGDTIKVEGETLRTIATITDDTHLTVGVAFSTSVSGLTYIVHPGIPSAIPAGLKHAMYLMVGHYYMNREPVVIGVGLTKLPFAFEYLVNPYKHWTIV